MDPQSHAQSFDADEVVASLYRGILTREPEEGAIDGWRPRLLDNGLVYVLDEFLRSPEFRQKIRTFVEMFPFDQAPPQTIETDADGPTLARLWERMWRAGTKLANDEPYFSVLSEPRWRGVPSPEALEIFYATGEGDLRRLRAWLARNHLALKPDAVCVEYGCGVGRFVEWIAPQVGRVVGFDVSEKRLGLARKRHEAKFPAGKVAYERLSTPASLAKLAGADLFYSLLVLQHLPPPVIATVLDAAFAGLNEGGIACFQVPTRGADGYEFRTRDYLDVEVGGATEMHALEQQTVFEIAARHRVRPIEVSPDYCGDGRGVSTTFLMRKG